MRPEECLRALLESFQGPLYVGFSGGVDSTALLLAASRVAEVTALHVDHGIHPDSNQWTDRCASICQSLGVAIESKRLQLPSTGNLEANARAERYTFFQQHVAEDGLLLLGHHETDQLESVLLRMFQGRGLVGMQSVGRVAGVPVARPFVGLRKAELVSYVEASGLTWLEDPSNADTRFDRNFLRCELLPGLLGRWPDAPQAVHRVANAQRHRDRALEMLLAEYRHYLPLPLLPQEEGVAVVMLRAWLQGQGLFSATDQSLKEFVAQCARGDNARITMQQRTLVLKGEKIHLT